MSDLSAVLASRVLLGSDSEHLDLSVQEALIQAGFLVDVARGYEQAEQLWNRDRHDVVLIEVSYAISVDPAVQLALRLKRQDRRQFVGYLADPILHTSGLAGDALFSRDSRRLAAALRRHLQPATQ